MNRGFVYTSTKLASTESSFLTTFIVKNMKFHRIFMVLVVSTLATLLKSRIVKSHMKHAPLRILSKFIKSSIIAIPLALGPIPNGPLSHDFPILSVYAATEDIESITNKQTVTIPPTTESPSIAVSPPTSSPAEDSIAKLFRNLEETLRMDTQRKLFEADMEEKRKLFETEMDQKRKLFEADMILQREVRDKEAKKVGDIKFIITISMSSFALILDLDSRKSKKVE